STRTSTRSRASPTATSSSRRDRSSGPAARASWDARRTSSTGTSGSDRGGRTVTWIDPDFPRTAEPTDRVARVLRLNPRTLPAPGSVTAPGTNTYLVGRRRPILIDTGVGVPECVPLFADYLSGRGWTRPERIVLTHRHRDHMGGVGHLSERFPGVPVAKMLFK